MAITYSTWNPSDKDTHITLSNGNLTSTQDGTASTWSSVRSSVGVSSGKWYWEIKVTTAPEILIGIANSTASLANYIGVDVNGWSYYESNGNKFNNGSVTYGANYTTNDVIGIALDMDAGTLTFYKNNTTQGQAFTGITGTVYATFSGNQSMSAIANFGATALTYTPPSGYNAGLYSGGVNSGFFNLI